MVEVIRKYDNSSAERTVLVNSKVRKGDLQPLVEMARASFSDNRVIFGDIVGRKVADATGERSLLSKYMYETGRYAALNGLLCDVTTLLKDARVILDLMVATGHVPVYLIHKLEKHPLPDGKKRVFLLNETSPVFRDITEQRVASVQADRAEVRLYGCCPTSFEKRGYFTDGQIDIILWENYIHIASDRSKIMLEALRLLKPGGKLIVIEEFPHVEIPASYMSLIDHDEDAFLKHMILKSMTRPMDSQAFTKWVIKMWLTSFGKYVDLSPSTASELIRDPSRPGISCNMLGLVFTKPESVLGSSS